MKNKKYFIFIFLVVVFCAIGLSGCSSVRKDGKKSLHFSDNYTCNYNSTTNITTVIFKMQITNDSIYDILSEKIKFKMFLDDNLVDTKIYTWTIYVGNGKTEIESCRIEYSGNINKIVYDSWDCEYDSVWNTYKTWFIATIVVAAVLLIVSIVLIIAMDIDLVDVGDFLAEYWWISFTIAVPFIPYIINAFVDENWNWVPPVIIGGAICAIIAIDLIVFLIKYIVDYGTLGIGYGYAKDYFSFEDDGKEYTIEDCQNDKDKLMLFTKEQLINWCRVNNIVGYSKLTKSELVDFISNSNDNTEKTDNPKEKETNKLANNKKTGIKFDDIAGLEKAKQAFNEKVILPIQHKDLYEKYGKKVGGGILLYGLPGTGKTMFAEAASNELNALFISIKCSDIKSKWYGESEQKVKDIFSKARRAKKAIIFFDEFEAIGAKRTDNSDNGNNDLVPQILAEMQGVGTSSSDATILVIAATNKPWSIDSAFLRPGRFDEKIYIPLPDFEARKKMFELQLSKIPHKDLNYDLLANLTDGCNGADIKEVCEKLKMNAINNSIKKGFEQPIDMNDVENIRNSIKSSVQYEDIEKLEEFNNL